MTYIKLTPEEKKERSLQRQKEQYEREHKIIDGIIHKWCCDKKHWVEMDNEHFYKNDKNSIDGFSNRCKECDKTKTRKLQAEDPEKHKKDSLSWHHKNKEKILPRFRERRKLKKEHDRMMVKKYLDKHPEKVKQYSKNRQEKNHRISEVEWENCKKYFCHRCAYCGLTIEEHWVKRKDKMINMDFHKEHVIWNGKDNLKNCVPSCNSCNSEKWEHPLNYWYNSDNPKYTYERYYKIYTWLRYDHKKYIQKRKPKQKYERKSKQYKNY